MMKLLKLWAKFGLKVMGGYITSIDRVGAASVIFIPFMLLGFTIPWVIVYVLLLGLNMVQGWFVYDLTFKEQFDCVKEGFRNGVNHPEDYLE